MTAKKTTKKTTQKPKADLSDIPVDKDLEKAPEEKPLSGVTLQELEIMVQEFRDQKDDYDQKKNELGKAKELMDNTGNRILAVLKQFNKTSYKTCYGTMIRSERWSWKTPKTDKEKKEFYDYLKSKDLFDSMISVNSQTLNAFCKKEMEAAKEDQNLDFTIPGLHEPSVTETIAIRR